MAQTNFKPMHINATQEDFLGNKDIGRYLFIPGCDDRAKAIAEHFVDLSIKPHPRGHHLYLGYLPTEKTKIAVASVSSGMGCPSMEIILHELYSLGAKRFLRIGTSGSLQPGNVVPGNLINVQAAVRDEKTSVNYAPIEVPAIASLEYISAILFSAQQIGLAEILHTGTVHCKSALYAREFCQGPRAEENQEYLNLLSRNGILASEMETATLFIQSQFYNHELSQKENHIHARVLAGAILSITHDLEQPEKTKKDIENAIKLGLETVKTLAAQELIG